MSIVGTGMTLEGDSETDGSLRIEGTIRGNVRAGKSVVIGKDGLLEGSISQKPGSEPSSEVGETRTVTWKPAEIPDDTLVYVPEFGETTAGAMRRPLATSYHDLDDAGLVKLVEEL